MKSKKIIDWRLFRLPRQLAGVKIPAASLFSLVMLLAMSGMVSLRADGPIKVGLVVRHGDGKTVTQCVELPGGSNTGQDVLEAANLDYTIEAQGMGAVVCSLNGEGCNFPAETCFCQCQGSPCIYWSYWHMKSGDWEYSNLGASNYSVKHGDVEGWQWGEGYMGGGSVTKPPKIAFDEICIPPTATPSPTITSTATPTATPLPTNTPAPTNTPKPRPTPVIHSFSASRTAINAGEQVTLSWDLSDAEAAYLRYNGIDEGVIAPGSKTVSPGASTVYTLVAKNDSGESTSTITINVNGAPPAPTSTPAPTTAAPAPVAVSQAAPPISTPAIPTPVISFGAASTTLPAGACTNLRWSVQQADAVFLDDAPVAAESSQQVCPAQTQTFRLRAVSPAGEQTTELLLTVTDALLLPADTPTPAAVAAQPAPPTHAPAADPAALVIPAEKPHSDSEPAEPRRFKVESAETGEAAGSSWLAVGGVIAAIGFFVVLPVSLLVAGWVAWLAKGKAQ